MKKKTKREKSATKITDVLTIAFFVKWLHKCMDCFLSLQIKMFRFHLTCHPGSTILKFKQINTITKNINILSLYTKI